MIVDSDKMYQYAEFLEEKSNDIIALCSNIQTFADIASQCLDSVSAKKAADSLSNSLEIIKKNVPVSTEAGKRLVKSKRHLDELPDILGGK